MRALTKPEIAALHLYSSPSHKLINGCLLDFEPCTPEIRTAISLIGSAISASPKLANDRYFFRGVSVDVAAGLRSSDFGVGFEFDVVQFLSLSSEEAGAKPFAAWPAGGMLFRVLVPAGTPALDMEPYSHFPDEREFLLPCDMTMRITRYQDDMSIDAEIVS